MHSGFSSKAAPLLVVCGLLAYANSLTQGFVFDDLYWVIEHPGREAARLQFPTAVGRPVLLWSLAFNHALGGDTPVGYHAFNLAVHLLAGLTLFGLARRTLRLPRWGGRFADRADGLGFAVAAVWTVHPLTTQAVTYMIQRCESMMGLFVLVSFYGLVRAAAADRRWPWYALSAAAFAVACGCKEVALMAPPLLYLYDRTFLAGGWVAPVRRRPLYYAALAGLFALNVAAVAPAAAEGGVQTGGVGFRLNFFTPWNYLLTQTEVILHYLRLSLLPGGFSLDYMDWPIAKSAAEVWPAGLAVLGLLGLTAWAVAFRPAAGFLGAWFFLFLAPTSSVMPIIDVCFEHRMYLSLIGVVAGAVFAADRLVGRAAAARGWSPAGAGRARAGLLAAVLAVLAAQTYVRNEAYASQYTVWGDALAKRPNNVRALFTYTTLLVNANKMDEADGHLTRGERLAPHHPGVLSARGVWLEASGREKEAEDAYLLSVQNRLDPVFESAVERLGWLALGRGDAAAAAGRFRKLTELFPTNARYQMCLAAAELARGPVRARRAREAVDAALSLNPRAVETEATLARGSLMVRWAKSSKAFRATARWAGEAVALADPARAAEALNTTAMAAAVDGDFAAAAGAAERGVAAAEANGQPAWAAALRDRLELYRQKKPYYVPEDS